MKLLTTTAIITILAISPAFAQTATGVGTGVAASKSQSTAVAISGQGGRGGNATANAKGGTGVGVGTGGNPIAAVTIQGAPAATTETLNNTGTSTVKNVPSVFAPGLAAAGLETCLGSVSGGGSFVGTGFSFGSTIPDPGCAARLDARTLWSMGLKKAAIARLCLGNDVYKAMPDVCNAYLPITAEGVVPLAAPGYYYEEGNYRGGPIMLVEGKTGQERLCNDYDESKHRCRAWDGETRVVSVHHHKKVAAITPAAQPTPLPPTKTVAEEPKKEDSK